MKAPPQQDAERLDACGAQPLSVVVGLTNRGDHQMLSNPKGASRSARMIGVAIGFAWSTAALAYDPLNCLDDISRVDTEITVGLATRLCAGTWTHEPIVCYALVSKVDGGIPRGLAIDLCTGAVDADKTVTCYVDASEKRRLNRGLAIALCGARRPEK